MVELSNIFKAKAMLQAEQADIESNLWRNVVTSENDYFNSRYDFLNNCSDRVSAIKKALHAVGERATALRLIEYLKIEERQSLLNDLVDLASVAHSDIELGRRAILSLPKTWLLENIEKSAELLLKDGTDEEYRRLLELYIQIDRELTERLAKRALKHENPDIREAGADFQHYLDECGVS